jgi:hypothetical protein
MAVSTLFSAQYSRKGIRVVVLTALTIHRHDGVLLEALNPVGRLSLQILETHQPVMVERSVHMCNFCP